LESSLLKFKNFAGEVSDLLAQVMCIIYDIKKGVGVAAGELLGDAKYSVVPWVLSHTIGSKGSRRAGEVRKDKLKAAVLQLASICKPHSIEGNQKLAVYDHLETTEEFSDPWKNLHTLDNLDSFSLYSRHSATSGREGVEDSVYGRLKTTEESSSSMHNCISEELFAETLEISLTVLSGIHIYIYLRILIYYVY
jgi:hypothetical protein